MNMFHFSLGALMLVTGSINTLSVKWADTLKSESTDGSLRDFDHPFLQATAMFLGESFCLVAFFIITRWKNIRSDDDNGDFSIYLFLPAAICDMTATSIQYLALNLTYASSFQMLRGAVIVFTGLFSRWFLGRRLGLIRWSGILLVIVGLVIVGVCDELYIHPHTTNSTTLDMTSDLSKGGDAVRDSSAIILGDALIVCAQVVVASQMVYEEKVVSKYNVPALLVMLFISSIHLGITFPDAVGLEGVFGFTMLLVFMLPMYFIHVGPDFGNNPRQVLEDAYDGIYQLLHNGFLTLAFVTTICSIAFFNFAGISVTKEMSATTRMVLDSVRTLVIWAVSLLLGWQKFHWLQLVGFSVLVSGMALYNNLCNFGHGGHVDHQALMDEEEEDNESGEVNIYDPRSGPTQTVGHE